MRKKRSKRGQRDFITNPKFEKLLAHYAFIIDKNTITPKNRRPVTTLRSPSRRFKNEKIASGYQVPKRIARRMVRKTIAPPFQDTRRKLVCKKRKARRKAIFGSGKGGVKGLKFATRILTMDSKIRCR